MKETREGEERKKLNGINGIRDMNLPMKPLGMIIEVDDLFDLMRLFGSPINVIPERMIEEKNAINVSYEVIGDEVIGDENKNSEV